MRLKTLELKGFKSFADKTVLHFDQNMTGIVGPNGCGKSNTVDAIRWVLGETRSKNLRSEKMDNLIFNGTNKRKASGRAEVSLTFENTRNLLPTEFSTVTVSRIYYRTGDSEYRLNNVKCRLKDIHNLFMDTGVSSDSYAIIELKMIDEILNNKDHSRRRLFEQAAGISKFKIRKKQTLNKLKATDADLARVEDLLFEIEGNLKTLERQAKRAQRYNKIKEQYKELSIELAVHNLQSHKSNFKSLNKREEEESDRKIALQTAITQLEADLERKKAGIITVEKELAAIQKNLNEHVSRLNTAENNKNLLNQNIRFLREQKDSLSKQIGIARELTSSLEKELEYLKWDQKGEEEASEKMIEELGGFKDSVESARTQHNTFRQQLNELERQYRQLERQLFDQEKNIAIKRTHRDNIGREIKENKLRFESRQEELELLSVDAKKVEMESNEANEQLQTMRKEEDALRKSINDLETSINKNRQKLSDLNRQLDADRNEYKLTKSLVDSLEGFPDSVKYLQKNNQQWSDNAPLLLDILNCEEEYKLAIENYLKPHLNNYVVENVDEAIAAIHLLDKAEKGKANFFILNEFNHGADSPTPSSVADAVAAVDIINVEDTHQPLMQHLLKDVFIVNGSFDPKKEQENGSIFISKNGKFVRRRSTLTGGSVGAYEGKRIGRKQHLTKLEKAIDRQEKKVNELKGTQKQQQADVQQHQRDLKQKVKYIHNHQQKVDKLKQRALSYQLKIENSQSFIKESENKESSLADRVKELDQEIAKMNISFDQLNQQREELAKEKEKADQQFQEVAGNLRTANQSFNEKNIAYHKQQNRIQSILQNITFKDNQLQQTKEQLTTNQLTLEETQKKLKDIEGSLQHSGDELSSLYVEKEQKEKELSEVETRYYDERGNLDQLEKNIRIQTKNKEQVDQLLIEVKEKKNQLQIKLLSLKERLHIEFKVDINDIIDNDPLEEWDKESLGAKVEKLKGQIDRFGEINPFAVEAYDEMKTRYDFIIEQRDDLNKAKETLLTTIKEIEDTATVKFMDAFTKAREHFIQVFQSLFREGDQCDLFLTDPENPLDSTIDIIAKPKGKRPQTINQLSGGEKSLTALALIFSLYLLKPAPFCILDEVDAPLDDHNVGKFTKIIRQFSENSQFIIVTHNKNTMASVDTIYGVVMEDQGISKVVPADFRYLDNIL